MWLLSAPELIALLRIEPNLEVSPEVFCHLARAMQAPRKQRALDNSNHKNRKVSRFRLRILGFLSLWVTKCFCARFLRPPEAHFSGLLGSTVALLRLSSQQPAGLYQWNGHGRVMSESVIWCPVESLNQEALVFLLQRHVCFYDGERRGAEKQKCFSLWRLKLLRKQLCQVVGGANINYYFVQAVVNLGL